MLEQQGDFLTFSNRYTLYLFTQVLSPHAQFCPTTRLPKVLLNGYIYDSIVQIIYLQCTLVREFCEVLPESQSPFVRPVVRHWHEVRLVPERHLFLNNFQTLTSCFITDFKRHNFVNIDRHFCCLALPCPMSEINTLFWLVKWCEKDNIVKFPWWKFPLRKNNANNAVPS